MNSDFLKSSISESNSSSYGNFYLFYGLNDTGIWILSVARRCRCFVSSCVIFDKIHVSK